MATQFTPLAIVGMGALFPDAAGLAAYWRLVREGQDAIRPIPSTHWAPEDYFTADPKAPDMTYAQRGGFVPEVPFDAGAFGLVPSTLEATDASQLLGLWVADRALKDAGLGPGTQFDRDRVSVILGVTGALPLVIPLGARLGHPHWKRALEAEGLPEETTQRVLARMADAYVPWQEASFPGLLGNVVAGRIANRLDLHGTNATVDAACASSFAALHSAAMELQTGRAKVVVTGGVDAFNDIFMYMCFSKTPALSPSGDARPFDAEGDGTILGEGLGMVVLKTLAQAEADGDRIYAVVKGVGTASDGRGKAIYAPDDKGQARCLRDAYAVAGVAPETVGLLEAHGTGTKVGDATELKGLRAVFPPAPAPYAQLGSVKGQIGHTKAAAGAAGLIKAALALHHKVRPPSIKVRQPLPDVVAEGSPFALCTEARPWVARAQHPRRAGVSAFGFGGSDFHVVLEEHRPEKAAVDWDGRLELVPLHGEHPEALLSALGGLEAIGRHDLPAAARARRAAFDPKARHRLVLVVQADRQDGLAQAIAEAKAKLSSDLGPWQLPSGSCHGHGPTEGGLALLIPGQGAQAPGMGQELALTFPEALAPWSLADAAVGELLPGRPLSEVAFPPTAWDEGTKQAQAGALTDTRLAQPAIGAVAWGSWGVLKRFGLRPDALAGHSYGELVALAIAGAYDAEALFALSALRGRLMAEGGDGEELGTMAAVHGPLAEVEAAIAPLQGEHPALVLANRNAPRQAVVAGTRAGVAAAVAACKAKGFRATPLQVGAAFHSPLVAGAAAPFGEALAAQAFAAPRLPVYADATAAPYPSEAGPARALLARQLAEPVRFVELIEAMHAAGVRSFLELAPGARLTGLVGQILEGKPHGAFALEGPAGRRPGLPGLAMALAWLAARGHAVDLSPWQGGDGPLPAPEPAPKLPVPLNGANLRTSPRLELPPAPRPLAQAAAPPAPPPQAPAPSAPLPPVHPALEPEAPAMRQEPAPAAPHPDAWAALAGQLAALQAAQAQAAALHERFLISQAELQAGILAALEAQQRLLMGGALAPAQVGVSAWQAPAPQNLTLPTPGPLTAVPPPSLPSHLDPVAPGGPTLVPPAPMGLPEAGAPGPAPMPTVAPAPVAPPPAPAPWAPLAPAHEAPPPPAPAPAVVAPSGAAPSGAEGLAGGVLAAVLAVVAEKTGYPESMLSPEQALEADLGVDSIKRVEIVAALSERLPGAPELPGEALASLVSLGDVVAALVGAMGAGANPASALQVAPAPAPGPGSSAPAPVAPPPPAPAPAVVAPSGAEGLAGGVLAAVLAVVAEKTGYPESMLSPEQALEADLGVDSIKRVEIVAALSERLPGAPELPGEALASLVSLGDVVAALVEAMGGGVAGKPQAAPAPAPQGAQPPVAFPAPTPTPSSVLPSPAKAIAEDRPVQGAFDEASLLSAVLAVVAEKTGYPESMLSPEQALEADLGVDSIKRVEIVAALSERLPGAPELPGEALASLVSLGDVVRALAEAMASGPPDPDGPGGPGGGLAASPPAGLASATSAGPSAWGPPAGGGPAAPGEGMGAGPVGLAPSPYAWPALEGLAVAKVVAVPLAASPELAQPKLPRGAKVWVAGAPGDALAEALGNRLQALGHPVQRLDLAAPASWPSPQQISGVFIVGPSRPGAMAAEAGLAAAIEVARRVEATLKAGAEGGGACFMTLSRLDGAFGLGPQGPGAMAPWGGLAGLAKTAAREWPEVACQALDVDAAWADATAAAADVVRELFLEGPVELGLSAEARWSLEEERAPLTPPAAGLPLAPGDLVLVSGGGRGVTAEVALAIAAHAEAPTVALLGRSPAPAAEPAWLAGIDGEVAIKRALAEAGRAEGQALTPAKLEEQYQQVSAHRAIRETLQRLEAMGAKALYRSADVGDAGQVAQVVGELQAAHGPVRLLVHGAGVLADKRLGELDGERVLRVLRPKLGGWEALAGAVDGGALRGALLFSSTTARLGRVGQGAYAVANEALNKLAQLAAQRWPQARVVALGWGPWAGGMVSPALAKVFAAEGVPLVPLAEGGAYGAWALAGHGLPAVELTVMGGGQVASVHGHRGPAALAEAPLAPAAAPPLAAEAPWALALTRVVDLASSPFLKDHVLAGQAVLPAAMMMEWLAEGAASAQPGRMVVGVEDFAVLKGLLLAEGAKTLRVEVGPVEARLGGELAVQAMLIGAEGGHRHAKAKVILAPAFSAAPASPAPLSGPSMEVSELYGVELFHGPNFHALRAVEAIGSEGAEAVVAPEPDPGSWLASPPGPTWRLAPLALDAVFQLQILWARRHQSGPCLPSGVQALRLHAPWPAGPTRLRLRVVEASARRQVAEVAFLDEAGQVIATLQGAEATVDPGLQAAFQANRLQGVEG